MRARANRWHRKDGNQVKIVDALRRVGADVYHIGRPVDIMVGWRNQTYLFELKDGAKSPSQRKLQDSQTEFLKTWQGGPAMKIETLADAFKALGIELR